jgi:hypothetical protein
MSRPRKIRLRFDISNLRRDARDGSDASCSTVRHAVSMRVDGRRRKLARSLAVDKQRLENQGCAHVSPLADRAIAQVIARRGLARRRRSKHWREQRHACLSEEVGAQHNWMEMRRGG